MLTLASLLLALAPAQAPSFDGLVEIPAGPVFVGSTKKDIIKRIEAGASAGDAQYLGAETPQYKVTLPRFGMTPTEVTNEMYLQFVLETGYAPPATWAKFSREMRTAIIAAGKVQNGLAWAFNELNQGAWWAEHNQDGVWAWDGKLPHGTATAEPAEFPIEWEMHPSTALEPVVFVNFKDAQAYCLWAGLRLPTEEEWIRAGRADKKWDYPFGKDWDPTKVACKVTESKKRLAFKRLPVNSLENISAFGCVDMVGNVWEWVGSPFEAHPKFKSFAVGSGKSKIDVVPDWDSSYGVIKGAAFQTGADFCRLTTRIGIDRSARTNIIGFRAASSGIPCQDTMELYGAEVPSKLIGGLPHMIFDFKASLGLEKRNMAELAPIEASREKPKNDIPETTPPDGYGVFDAYEMLAVAPMRELDFASESKFNQFCKKENRPIPIGLLVSTHNLSAPNTTPGSFVLAYIRPMKKEEILLSGGIVPKVFMPKELPEPNGEGFDLKGFLLKPGDAHLAILDHQGEIIGIFPTVNPPKLVRLASAKHDVSVNLDKDAVEFRLAVGGPRGKAWSFRFRVKPLGNQGSLAIENYWDGDYYGVIQPKE